MNISSQHLASIAIVIASVVCAFIGAKYRVHDVLIISLVLAVSSCVVGSA